MMMAYLENLHGILLHTYFQMISVARENLCFPSLPWDKHGNIIIGNNNLYCYIKCPEYPLSQARKPMAAGTLQQSSFHARNAQPEQGRQVKEHGKKEEKGDTQSHASSQWAPKNTGFMNRGFRHHVLTAQHQGHTDLMERAEPELSVCHVTKPRNSPLCPPI